MFRVHSVKFSPPRRNPIISSQNNSPVTIGFTTDHCNSSRKQRWIQNELPLTRVCDCSCRGGSPPPGMDNISGRPRFVRITAMAFFRGSDSSFAFESDPKGGLVPVCKHCKMKVYMSLAGGKHAKSDTMGRHKRPGWPWLTKAISQSPLAEHRTHRDISRIELLRNLLVG